MPSSSVADLSSSLTYQSPSIPTPSPPPDIRLLHFNDVYHIEAGSAEPVGGLARFQTLRNFYCDDEQFKGQPDLITLFSGDAYNPSLESSITKGAHMVPVLNGLMGKEGTGVACVGTAKALVPALRAQGADIVVALTHAREPSDVKLAEKTPPGLIDLILGGHDHFYAHQIVNKTHVLRSGTDFKQLSYIEAYRRSPSESPSTSDHSSPWDFRITRHDIVRAIPEDPPTVQLVDKLTSTLKHRLEKPVGYTFVPLDARFTTVRTRESNLGNFVCDLMRHHYSADCALMAGGTIRGDQVYPPGVLRLKDIMDCFPFEDPVVVIRIRGKAIREALENSVVLVPALEGRYCQVSGVRFSYNASLPPGSRVLWVEVANQLLDEHRIYTVATRGYMGRGKDGFDSLLVKSEGGEAEEIVSEENGILISMILRQYFMSLKVLGKWRRWGPSLGRHWAGVQDKFHQHSNMEVVEPKKGGHKHTRSGNVKDGDADGEHHEDSDEDIDHSSIPGTALEAAEQEKRKAYLARSVTRHWMRVAGIHHGRVGMIDGHDAEDVPEYLPDWTKGIAPKVEGRIVIEGDDDGSVKKQ
ncbi:MAG: hypothetical protein Q9201_006867 [Fulgogasparrea decipioides]